jgi:HrpA-like RNA helicase
LIICTQPRRIAAISLAKRVAEELNEPIGRSVGFMIGADRVVGQHTRVRFVTTGWAMEKLLHSNYLEEITHLVLDEVHERSIDADLLHLVIKLVLPKVKTIGCLFSSSKSLTSSDSGCKTAQDCADECHF